MMNTNNLDNVAAQAHAASVVAPIVANSTLDTRNEMLRKICASLKEHCADIVSANKNDIARARQNALAQPLLKRLYFQEQQITQACAGIEAVIALSDPLNQVHAQKLLDEGLVLSRRTVPIGTIGVVFESRPDALLQIASLCLKSGNCCLMKGGSEAEETNRILAKIVIDATGEFTHWFTLLTTRDEINELIDCVGSVDLIIPRGSNEFVQSIMKRSAIPVLGHADGVCHVYIDRLADYQMAQAITIDAKTQYPAVCNALECLLIHQHVAADILPPITSALRERDVILYGCARSQEIVSDINPASEKHWGHEYLSRELSIRIVNSLRDAIAHINHYGSKHTDAIVTQDSSRAEQFLHMVDSSSVMWNCSTRFSDGYRYGLGAEVGVATGKIHARGPVGLEGLLTYKWVLTGNGHVVADYSGENAKSFLHQRVSTS